jgi:uncharacterized protein
VLVSRTALVLGLSLLLGCSPPPAPSTPACKLGQVRAGTPAGVDIALARAKNGDKRARFAWSPLSEAAFARAKKEGKLILLDGAAEWCHWCHVMDETTYADERVGALLAERFVAVRVDVDERPDIAERYGDWGWPATIVLSPDGEEIGKYRGYLPPDEMLTALSAALSAGAPGAAKTQETAIDTASLPAAREALPWIAARTALELDDWYDPNEGSWGRRQKSPLGANVLFELRRAARGDGAALGRAVFTLEKQRGLLDPIWGGVYQYSTGGTWAEPHYEKLMLYQTQNLEAYAAAYARTRRPDLLEDARRIARYMTAFLSSPEGGFYASQDADVNAHDKRAPFVDGDVYYRLGDAERRKLGIPRVDDHVYAYENGLAVAAMCALFEVSGDVDALARAERAAGLVVRTHVDEAGLVKHDSKSGAALRHLADTASLGLALVRLSEASRKKEWLGDAARIARAMEEHLADQASGAYFAHTLDPRAVGVFARRERPFSHNVLAARFLAALGRATSDNALTDRARRVVSGISTPRAVAAQGRVLGEFLLVLDAIGVFPWPDRP